VAIPLACFGADLAHVDTPFSVTSDGPFAAAFGNVDVTTAAEAVACGELQ
jgi:beta-glucosidase